MTIGLPGVIVSAEQACDASGYKNAALLDTLAVAYAEEGRFRAAVRTATKALELAEPKQKSLVEAIGRHLEHFKSGRPWRQRP